MSSYVRARAYVHGGSLVFSATLKGYTEGKIIFFGLRRKVFIIARKLAIDR